MRTPGFLAIAGLALTLGCEQLTTPAAEPDDLFDAPIDGLSSRELSAFLRGDEEFGRPFSAGEGLGPLFNNTSCAGCHSGDGRGNLSNRLTRFSQGTDLLFEVGGPQLQDKSLPTALPERLPPGVQVSVRLPPPVFGAGLIEAIPDAAILANVDSLDADGDGISGRPNWVTPPAYLPATEPGAGPGLRIGRFGRKAQVSALLQQVTEAYQQDMGITSDFIPAENYGPGAAASTIAADRVADPELPADVVLTVTNYLRMLAAPAPGRIAGSRLVGDSLFETIGCATCHVRTFQTGVSPIPAVAGRTVTLYSDLLLHDMGAGLADDRPDGSADGREFRTAPLWGLRLMRSFLNGQALLLHDGRARSVEEAILLHGGEATAARDQFAALTPLGRAALLDFVGSR
ncbi:MAG: di-heme oxidoredictase family protein [Gemmatimonadota bacterium]|mgnify:CR=1 FL=1|nr:di-heme oxidoredictase family protein [Gemmatimonadota bacterium]